MKILVTGASGFLGTHLARALAAGGAEVVGLSRSGAAPSPAVRTLAVDLADGAAVATAVADAARGGLDAVAHTAAMTDVAACERDPDRARLVNACGTRDLVAALARHAPAARLVHVSTDLVFDGRDAPYAEGATPRPVSAYGRSKVAAEALALAHPDALVLRVALLYGPRAGTRATFLQWMVDTLRAGGDLRVFVDEHRTPLAVEDACRAITAALERRTGEARLLHAGGPDRLSRYAMAELTARAYGLDPSRIVATRLADSTFAAPRPADVALDARRLWSLLGAAPAAFGAAVRAYAAADT